MDMRKLINLVEGKLMEATLSAKQPGDFVSLNEKGTSRLSEVFEEAGIDPMAIYEFVGEFSPLRDASGKTALDPEYGEKYGAHIVPTIFFPGDEDADPKTLTKFHLKDEHGYLFHLVGGSKAKFDTFFVNVKETITNRGEIAEGILAAAMFAKFIARAADEEIGQVTAAGVVAVLNELGKGGGESHTLISKDSDNKHADEITLTIKLKAAATRELMDPNKRKFLANEYASAISYANSSSAERYSRYFYINGRADTIHIISDGTSDETGRKTDVWVEVKDHKTGDLRKLRLDVSLKAGAVKQFGQVYGNTWDSMVKLWDFFNIDITEYQQEYEDHLGSGEDALAAMGYMYKMVTDQINNTILSDTPGASAEFATDLAGAIEHFATLGDRNIELVHFKSGAFEVLRFRDLGRKLVRLNLQAVFVNSNAQPKIDIVDPSIESSDSKVLVTIRAKIEHNEGGMPRVRNLIEKGPLLAELTAVHRGAEMSKKEHKAYVNNVLQAISSGGVKVGPSASKKKEQASLAPADTQSIEQAAGRGRR